MIRKIFIFFWACSIIGFLPAAAAPGEAINLRFEIFGDTIQMKVDATVAVPFEGPLSEEALLNFHHKINISAYESVLQALLQYKDNHSLNDWMYYQLVRKTAQQLAPKQENYYRYTLYKWFLLVKSGYDATLNIFNDQLLMYIYSNDDVFNLPLYNKDSKQYVCLNIHDYLKAGQDFKETIQPVDLPEPAAITPFSYTVTQLPEFKTADYYDRPLNFSYGSRDYHFVLKVNPKVKSIFANYPVVRFEQYFNIPMSKTTYKSLVPMIKGNLKGKKVKNGVDYLMKFTRYAFLYEDDRTNYGKEKRMAPEETLLSDASDCDDRAALFFFLVKEIYDLPMIVLLYPDHITIAVAFDKGYGKTIAYQGKKYSICEPTPQEVDLAIGQTLPSLRQVPYEVVYAYHPKH